jgi:hypothetical protein
MRAFSRVLQSLRFQDSNRNSLLARKVSRVFLGNGRFAESKCGDWFELPLSGGCEGIRTSEFHFREQSVQSGPNRVTSFDNQVKLVALRRFSDRIAGDG